MFLAPSHIHFTDCTGLLALHEITPEESFIEISRKIVQKGDCPKLQVVEKAGNFFTLNNTQLHVFRRLEAQGKCPRVRVDKVPLSEIPEGILRMMVIPVKNNNSDDNAVILKSPAGKSEYSSIFTLYIDNQHRIHYLGQVKNGHLCGKFSFSQVYKWHLEIGLGNSIILNRVYTF